MHLDTLTTKLNELAARAEEIEDTWKHSNMLGGRFDDQVGYESLMTEVLSIVEHIHGRTHAHYQRITHWYSQNSLNGLQSIRGILLGVAKNIQSGFLSSLKSRVAIEISTDFLATAKELAEAGDKDPASVLACCVLEDVAKRLAAKNNIDSAKNQDFSVVINSLLAQKVIEKSTHASLMSFRPLRNAAFHAQWHEVSIEAVAMLLMFLPVFMEKHGVEP